MKRLQQYTSGVQAKGIEDLAYIDTTPSCLSMRSAAINPLLQLHCKRFTDSIWGARPTLALV